MNTHIIQKMFAEVSERASLSVMLAATTVEREHFQEARRHLRHAREWIMVAKRLLFVARSAPCHLHQIPDLFPHIKIQMFWNLLVAAGVRESDLFTQKQDQVWTLEAYLMSIGCWMDHYQYSLDRSSLRDALWRFCPDTMTELVACISEKTEEPFGATLDLALGIDAVLYDLLQYHACLRADGVVYVGRPLPRLREAFDLRPCKRGW